MHVRRKVHARMLASAGMSLSESRKQQVARQLQALMERHRILDAAAFERLAHSKGHVVSQVTIRRIKQASAKGEPEPDTLRKLADTVGETYAIAFPEAGDVIVAEGHLPDGRRWSFRAERPLTVAEQRKIATDLTMEKGIEQARRKKEMMGDKPTSPPPRKRGKT